MKIKFLNILIFIFSIFSFTIKADEVIINNDGAMVFHSGSVTRYFFDNIRKYDVEISINNDGTLFVVEKIDFFLGDKDESEVTRDIPLRTREKNFDLNRQYIEMLEISRDGKIVKYDKEKTKDGIRYKIKKDRKGLNKYIFKYKIHNAIVEKNGNYQIYFNAIGNDWNMVMDKVNTTIKYFDGSFINKKDINYLEIITGYDFFGGENNYEILSDSGVLKIKNKYPYDLADDLKITLNLKSDKIKISILKKLKSLFYAENIIIITPIIYLFLIIYVYFIYKQKINVKNYMKKNKLSLPFYLTLFYFIIYTFYRMSYNGVEIIFLFQAFLYLFFGLFLSITILVLKLIAYGKKKIGIGIICSIWFYMLVNYFGIGYVLMLCGLPVIWKIFNRIISNERFENDDFIYKEKMRDKTI